MSRWVSAVDIGRCGMSGGVAESAEWPLPDASMDKITPDSLHSLASASLLLKVEAR